MRYHFVVNGYTDDIRRQMEEQAGFAGKYLSGMKEGEAMIYCRRAKDIQSLNVRHAKEAVMILASEYIPEIILDALCSQANPEDLYIFGSDNRGIELAVRMAARLAGSSITEVETLRFPNVEGNIVDKPHILVTKMVYANHMEAVFELNQGPFCVSLARGCGRQKLSPCSFTVREKILCEGKASHIVSQEFYPEDTDTGLENAKIILAAGRGIKNKENMAVIDEAARYLNAEVAVSRPAAMNAWKPMNRLIGVSGAMAEPDICITAGVSGAAAFYAGIEKSGFIAAINTDKTAPIMKMADVAIVDDFLPVMEELRNICK